MLTYNCCSCAYWCIDRVWHALVLVNSALSPGQQVQSNGRGLETLCEEMVGRSRLLCEEVRLQQSDEMQAAMDKAEAQWKEVRARTGEWAKHMPESYTGQGCNDRRNSGCNPHIPPGMERPARSVSHSEPGTQFRMQQPSSSASDAEIAQWYRAQAAGAGALRGTPMATAAVDTTGDGRANALVRGVDRDRDGIPDVLQGGGMMGGDGRGAPVDSRGAPIDGRGAPTNPHRTNQRQTRLKSGRMFNHLEIDQLLSIYLQEAMHKPAMQRPDFDSALERMMGLDPNKSEDQLLASTLFEVFDCDGNGWIEQHEFFHGLTMLCRGSVHEKLRVAFRIFDRNRSGRMNEYELREMLRRLLPIRCYSMLDSMVEKVLREADWDGDRRLTEDEFSRHVLSKEVICWIEENVRSLETMLEQKDPRDAIRFC